VAGAVVGVGVGLAGGEVGCSLSLEGGDEGEMDGSLEDEVESWFEKEGL